MTPIQVINDLFKSGKMPTTTDSFTTELVTKTNLENQDFVDSLELCFLKSLAPDIINGTINKNDLPQIRPLDPKRKSVVTEFGDFLIRQYDIYEARCAISRTNCSIPTHEKIIDIAHSISEEFGNSYKSYDKKKHSPKGTLAKEIERATAHESPSRFLLASTQEQDPNEVKGLMSAELYFSQKGNGIFIRELPLDPRSHSTSVVVSIYSELLSIIGEIKTNPIKEVSIATRWKNSRGKDHPKLKLLGRIGFEEVPADQRKYERDISGRHILGESIAMAAKGRDSINYIPLIATPESIHAGLKNTLNRYPRT